MFILLYSITLFPLLVLAQSDSLIKYGEVIPVIDTEKGELFNRARAWYNEAFRDAKDVVQISDKESGELNGKGYMRISVPFKLLGQIHYREINVQFNINVWLKDNRYKYELLNFEATDQPPGEYKYGYLKNTTVMPIKLQMVSQKKADLFWGDILRVTDEKAKSLIESLKARMLKPVTVNENW